MDLIANAAFRLLKSEPRQSDHLAGIYRIVVDDPFAEKTVAVCISPEEIPVKRVGGRYEKADAELKKARKKKPEPLVGKLIWMDRTELLNLAERRLLLPLSIERRIAPEPVGRSKREFDLRATAMAGFLDIRNLQESIVVHGSLGGLVKDAMAAANVSRPFVYKQWSNLCRWGLDLQSLIPQRDRCGAPGVARPCDSANGRNRVRKKAGRKTLKQRIGRAYGIELQPEQPGMSSEWTAAIRAADRHIPTPKPSWPSRCEQIAMSAFCANAKDEGGKVVLVKPAIGAYPNEQQIKRALTVDMGRLERLIERTTKQHFKMARRGLIGRNWQDVPGPGQTWAIDSTVGDIYLRSSVNRAWILGRPIVYVIVDVWSTAVVGFYVCVCGPSWSTAKVSLFNASADAQLVSGLWGSDITLGLNPAPSMCYSLMCDRGEYLSKGHRITAQRFLPLTSYAPPYRGDLKGLAEVLHRIEKDAQFLFIPGAMDHRRAELELRRVDPSTCVFTVREYTQYLFELFRDYNFTANRAHRVDAHMRAAGVFPSPAGLWRWGHEMGIGYRRHIEDADLISELLPAGVGRIRRDAVRFSGCDYMSDEIKEAELTTLARNLGGWDVDVNYYPGAMGPIWVPNSGGSGQLRLQISDQSMTSSEVTTEEWADAKALATIQRPVEEHTRTWNSLDSLARIQALRASAERETAKALAAESGASPTMTEARLMETAASRRPEASEAKAKEEVANDAMIEYERMMAALLRGNQDE